MPIALKIPTALRGFTDGLSQVELEGTTVGELLKNLTEKYPDLTTHLYDEAGALRSFVNVFVDGSNVKSLKGQETELKPGQTVMLVPAIAGGGPLAPETRGWAEVPAGTETGRFGG
ncbi:MAG: MoaD/ThiS family protein [Deltaproteobacteria bacterium]|jgi:molybdopterin converting factor small subunit|nr:MoaD/ThiS family protein [Deltaproteobacteria bacterium]